MGRYAQAANLLSQCARFYLAADEAGNAVDAMEEYVKSNWYRVARTAGVTEKDCEKISTAFAYPGFRLELSS
jgi:serine/threonine-protein kinase HipA